ncbi:hypothetical protein J2129_001348 [Methanofollis sp. W23]|nr:hypothetical protein [Methanofollis sp. W23]
MWGSTSIGLVCHAFLERSHPGRRPRTSRMAKGPGRQRKNHENGTQSFTYLHQWEDRGGGTHPGREGSFEFLEGSTLVQGNVHPRRVLRYALHQNLTGRYSGSLSWSISHKRPWLDRSSGPRTLFILIHRHHQGGGGRESFGMTSKIEKPAPGVTPYTMSNRLPVFQPLSSFHPDPLWGEDMRGRRVKRFV